jgi:hypothetical protein
MFVACVGWRKNSVPWPWSWSVQSRGGRPRIQVRLRLPAEARSTSVAPSAAPAMVVAPTIMTRSAPYFVDVETRGELTRGYTLVDVLGKLGRTPNTRVCLQADGARFRQLLLRMLSTD